MPNKPKRKHRKAPRRESGNEHRKESRTTHPLRHQHKPAHHTKTRNITGTISITAKGTGYVAVDKLIKDKKNDIEIDFKHLYTALHGDTVEIALLPKVRGRIQGEVVKVLERAKTSFAGVLQNENGVFFLRPDDIKMHTDLIVPSSMLLGAKDGQKVMVEMIAWTDHRKLPEGKVVKIIGQPGDNDVEMHSIALEKGFNIELPTHVESEAQKINEAKISTKDYEGRRDFRDTLTFTIDPYDAKDFDDAISFKKLGENLFEIGIHIADVSHYVKEGSDLDIEARERATSVYMVDRTIPMLPEILSNDLCSLVPNQDRLTMSAVFKMDQSGNVKDEWYGRTVIHSQKRFTYEEAEIGINSKNIPLHSELALLNSIAKKLTEERFQKGAISLDQEEVKFVLDSTGVPIKVIKKERGDSNRLIEEFMLLANRKVAETISKKWKKEGVFVYRVHDKPSREKMEDLAFFLKGLGYKITLRDGMIPNYEINNILNRLGDKPERDTVHRVVIRSMAKAIYSTENIGHYGLAFPYYTHFTSPIRRYPDIMVHRMLTLFLADKKLGKDKKKEYEAMARKSSEQEKKAQEAERASVKYKQVEYMSSRIGETFNGIISGITEWGMYVEEVETKCEGLIRVRDLDDDYYTFNEKHMELVGEKKKKKYTLGDKVKIKVSGVDLERKTIDYKLVK